MITEAYLTPCHPNGLPSRDLREEIVKLARLSDGADYAVTPTECYRIHSDQTAEVGSLLYVPASGRAGIAWSADAEWTDCNSAEDALARWISGEMVN